MSCPPVRGCRWFARMSLKALVGISLSLPTVTAFAQTYTFTTFAGAAGGSADGNGFAARFDQPAGSVPWPTSTSAVFSTHHRTPLGSPCSDAHLMTPHSSSGVTHRPGAPSPPLLHQQIVYVE